MEDRAAFVAGVPSEPDFVVLKQKAEMLYRRLRDIVLFDQVRTTECSLVPMGRKPRVVAVADGRA